MSGLPLLLRSEEKRHGIRRLLHLCFCLPLGPEFFREQPDLDRSFPRQRIFGLKIQEIPQPFPVFGTQKKWKIPQFQNVIKTSENLRRDAFHFVVPVFPFQATAQLPLSRFVLYYSEHLFTCQAPKVNLTPCRRIKYTRLTNKS